MPTKYPEDFKRHTVLRYERGEPIEALCQDVHIAPSTFYRWRNAYRSIRTPSRVYTPADIDALNRRLQKLQHELEIIGLSNCIKDVPLSDRLQILEQLHADYDYYSVYELCEALDVARGTFYNHILRRVDTSGKEAEQNQLMLQIQQVFNDSSQRFGAEKIRVILAQCGVHVSAKRVSSLMQEMDLRSIRPDAKKQFKKLQRNARKNLLKRDFTADAPNQIWVSDITCFKINGYWMYFCALLDLYSRKVVGYRVLRNASTNMVTAALRATYESRGKPRNLTFHSDCGKQYTSNAFTELLQQKGIKQSFSASGQPHDNAVAETFFATFKKEEAYRREYTSENAFRKSVDQFVNFYNGVRPHQTLKYQTPIAFEDKYTEKQAL